MKDKRSTRNDSQDDEDGASNSSKTDKPKRRKLRKRRSSCSPEEDVIDGFVIASYTSLRSLETPDSNESHSPLPSGKQHNGRAKSLSKLHENGHEDDKPLKELQKAENSDAENGRSSRRKTKEKEVEQPLVDGLSEQVVEQHSDDSSESGNSEKGYICDGESEDEQGLDQNKNKPVLPKLVSNDIEVIKEVKLPQKPLPAKVEKPVKDEEIKPITCHPQRVISSPKSSHTTTTPSIPLSSPSSLSLPRSLAVVSQSSWLPKLSSFQKPSSMVEPSYTPGSYSGSEALHQELNNRFLQSHSERERHSAKGQEMHQHSHLHHHQHQHTHFYPTPLLAAPTLFPASATPVVPNVLSPFSTPVHSFDSHSVPPFLKKTGKWCTAHVKIAWDIYYHQQKVQSEMNKDPHVKPEHISVGKSSPLAPSIPAHHMSPPELTYPSSHLRSSRFSGSRITKPSALLSRTTGNPYGSTVTSTTSAFSSVISSAARISTSPSGHSSLSSNIARPSSSNFDKHTPHQSSSSLYPWLKTETKDLHITHKCERGDLDQKLETKPDIWSPMQPVKGLPPLISEHPDPIRSGAFIGHDSRSYSPRIPRPMQPRSFLDKPVIPLEKRSYDYHRSGIGSLDLTRGTVYPQYDPMISMHTPHLSPLAPPLGIGYMYPGTSSYPSDAMYHHHHSSMAHQGSMFTFGSRDHMMSLGHPHDLPFYRRHDTGEDR